MLSNPPINVHHILSRTLPSGFRDEQRIPQIVGTQRVIYYNVFQYMPKMICGMEAPDPRHFSKSRSTLEDLGGTDLAHDIECNMDLDRDPLGCAKGSKVSGTTRSPCYVSL